MADEKKGPSFRQIILEQIAAAGVSSLNADVADFRAFVDAAVTHRPSMDVEQFTSMKERVVRGKLRYLGTRNIAKSGPAWETGNALKFAVNVQRDIVADTINKKGPMILRRFGFLLGKEWTLADQELLKGHIFDWEGLDNDAPPQGEIPAFETIIGVPFIETGAIRNKTASAGGDGSLLHTTVTVQPGMLYTPDRPIVIPKGENVQLVMKNDDGASALSGTPSAATLNVTLVAEYDHLYNS